MEQIVTIQLDNAQIEQLAPVVREHYGMGKNALFCLNSLSRLRLVKMERCECQ
jgi:hypothetical protein